LIKDYPHYSPYSFSGNKVIASIELEGLEDVWVADGGSVVKKVGPYVGAYTSEQAANNRFLEAMAGKPKVARPQAEIRSNNLEDQVNKFRGVNPGLAISRGIIDGTQAAPDVILPEIAMVKAIKAYKVFKQAKIAIKAAKAFNKVDNGAYHGLEFLDDGVRLFEAPIQKQSTKIGNLVDKVFEKKATHIIEGSENSIHNWEVLVPDKNPNKIKEIVKTVLEKGKDVSYKRGQAKSMNITANGVTKEVQVPYFKGTDGNVENFSTAFVK
jgi:hypothetical protein